jgi:hypothetical protein
VGGIVLVFQGIGRASAGASGMAYAVSALVLLLGPWGLAVLAMIGYLLAWALGIVSPAG